MSIKKISNRSIKRSLSIRANKQKKVYKSIELSVRRKSITLTLLLLALSSKLSKYQMIMRLNKFTKEKYLFIKTSNLK